MKVKKSNINCLPAVKKINAVNQKVANACILLLGIFIITGCKKYVEIQAPNTQLVTTTVFNNNATANSAMTAIYTQMFTNAELSGGNTSIGVINGLLADELTGYDNTTTDGSYLEYHNTMAAISNIGPWVGNQGGYNCIYQANAIIAGLQNNSRVSTSVKKQLIGEAYFVRAFWHFYLTNCYGAVPLVTTNDYTITSVLSRAPRVQVLQQVIADLEVAQSLLNNNYIDNSDTTTTTERTRPNKATATMMLARANLYLGDYNSQNASNYAKADSAATAVIGNNNYSLCANLSGANSVFLKNSSEAIWQLATPLPATVNTYDGQYYILTTAPSSNGGIGNSSLSPQLINSFESNDKRFTNWVSSVVAGGKTYYFPYKYKVQTGGSTISEYTMVLRLAEAYLIRAEARLHEANITGALSDLNAIRTRAGLPNYTGAIDQASLMSAIIHERQVELFTEWGHRWFDLERTNNLNLVMATVAPQKGTTWNPDGHQQLYPVPQNELTLDHNLTQNPGY